MSVIRFKKSLFFAFIFYAFLTAGIMQFLGIMGVTTGTIIIYLIIIFVFLLSSSAKGLIKVNAFDFFSISFLLYICTVGFIKNTDITLVILYCLFILIPLGFNNFFKDQSIYSKKLFKSLIFIAFLQVPVLILQKIYGARLGQISSKPFAELDSYFGTFPIADDHSLGFFFLSIVGFYLLNDFKKTKKIKFLMVVCFIGLFLINSAVSKILLLILLGIYIIRKLKIQIRFNKKILLLALTFISILVYYDGLVFIAEFFGKAELLDLSFEKASKFIASGTAGRFQTIVYFFNTQTLWFGNGPYSYFNPFNGTFNFNANFSQFIWFYFDLGVFGILFFLGWLNSLKKEMIYSGKHLSIYSEYLFLCFVAYSFFNTTLISLTSLSILFIFHYYQEKLILERFKGSDVLE